MGLLRASVGFLGVLWCVLLFGGLCLGRGSDFLQCFAVFFSVKGCGHFLPVFCPFLYTKMARRNLWAFYGAKNGHFLPLFLHKNAPRCYVVQLKTKKGPKKWHFLGIFCPFCDRFTWSGRFRGGMCWRVALLCCASACVNV